MEICDLSIKCSLIYIFNLFYILDEDLEFVEVNQDEMPEETWDSFESSDFYENFDAHQVSTQSAATSTTKTTRPALANGKFD